MATGVLPLVIGRATRLAQFLTASDKTYEATIAFGRTTDTFDRVRHGRDESDRRPTRDAARRGARDIPRHVRANAAGVLREEHRRRALVRTISRAEAQASAVGARGPRPCPSPSSASRSCRSTARRRGSTCRSRPASTCARSRTTSARRSSAARVLDGAAPDAVGRVRTGRRGPAGGRAPVAARIARRAAAAAVGPAAANCPSVTLRSANVDTAQERRRDRARRPRGAACRAPADGAAARPGRGPGGTGKTGENRRFPARLGGSGAVSSSRPVRPSGVTY